MSDQENAPEKTEDAPDDEVERAGYDDAEPVSPDQDPGGATSALNEEAAAAYAEAGTTESWPEGQDQPDPEADSERKSKD